MNGRKRIDDDYTPDPISSNKDAEVQFSYEREWT